LNFCNRLRQQRGAFHTKDGLFLIGEKAFWEKRFSLQKFIKDLVLWKSVERNDYDGNERVKSRKRQKCPNKNEPAFYHCHFCSLRSFFERRTEFPFFSESEVSGCKEIL
jgi:hypothetical protein